MNKFFEYFIFFKIEENYDNEKKKKKKDLVITLNMAAYQTFSKNPLIHPKNRGRMEHLKLSALHKK